jgi:hypothetical protein
MGVALDADNLIVFNNYGYGASDGTHETQGVNRFLHELSPFGYPLAPPRPLRSGYLDGNHICALTFSRRFRRAHPCTALGDFDYSQQTLCQTDIL